MVGAARNRSRHDWDILRDQGAGYWGSAAIAVVSARAMATNGFRVPKMLHFSMPRKIIISCHQSNNIDGIIRIGYGKIFCISPYLCCLFERVSGDQMARGFTRS